MRRLDKEKKEAKKLRLKGLSINRIAKVLSVSKSSVSCWVRGVVISDNQKRELKNNSSGNRKANKIRRKSKKKACIICDKPRERNSVKYCSRACHNVDKYNKYIEKWKKGEIEGLIGRFKDEPSKTIKKFMRLKHSNKCTKCGWSEVNPWTKIVPLQVDHKDGNYKNNSEDNLDLLCPNCHSLTQFFGGANRGKGRRNRYKRRVG